LKLEKITFILFALLFFLLPLVWTPINFELFEFNKMVLVYFFTIFIAAAWLIKVISEKKFVFQKNFLFLPLIVFFLSQLLSTVFSIDRHTSIFGYYSRFHGGLLSLSAYLLLFFALVNLGKREWVKKLIDVSLVSGALVALFGIAEHLGVDKSFWIQDVQRRVFSTLGQPNWLAAYLNILLMITLGRLIKGGKKDFFLWGLFFLCLLYTRSKSGFIGFLAGWSVFWALNYWLGKEKAKAKLKAFLFSFVSIVVLSLLAGTPFFSGLESRFFAPAQVAERGGLARETVMPEKSADAPKLNITPSGDIRKIVWRGALTLWRQHPFLGTGAETFAYSYYRVRPAEHNLTSEWDFLYNKAHNEYLNFAANTGTVGLAAYLFLIAVFLTTTIGRIRGQKRVAQKDKLLLVSLLSSWATILVTNFFGFTVVVTGFWFFLAPALVVLLLGAKGKKTTKTLVVLAGKQRLVFAVSGIVFLWFVYLVAAYWRADVLFAKARRLENMGNSKAAAEQIEKAISFNRREPGFYSHQAQVLSSLSLLSHQAGLATRSARLAREAVAASDRSLAISPNHPNLYKDRAKMFYTLSKIDLNYLKNSLEAVIEGTRLAPTDAKLFFNAGLMFHALGDNRMAKEYLEKALQLKPNYEQAGFWLEQFLPQ